MYQAEQVTISPEEWVSQCAALEARAECKKVKITCVEPNQTRIINEKPITKPCWKEEHTYACQYPSKNDCGTYHQPDCQQISSKCQFKVDGKCYIWQHKYECKKAQQLKTKRICGKDIFCIQGECYNPSNRNQAVTF
jgi:conjugal transfer mating pair stabilization protein TraN